MLSSYATYHMLKASAWFENPWIIPESSKFCQYTTNLNIFTNLINILISSAGINLLLLFRPKIAL